MSTITHTVSKGDTLSSIAKKYSTTVTALKKTNNLNSDVIKIGQKLQVPSTTNATNTTPTKSSLFEQMWGNFPFFNIRHKADEIDNYCAINLSEALIESGIKVAGGDCWGCPSGKSNTHYLRAADMAEWLNTKPFRGCPTPIKATGKNFKEQFRGKKGIIYLKDYWQRKHEEGTEKRTGDHIDPVDFTGLIPNFASNLITTDFLINYLGFSIDGYWSDKELSTEVLLWEFS